MLLKCYYILICVAGYFKLCYCQQSIAQGVDNATGKKYVVYFVQSPYTKKDQDSWMCGGALVSPTQILTAAACLIEAENIYAIAGYKKYIEAKDIESDECTRTRKQRVVKVLVPTEYKLAYENPAQWINVDVGVAVVEKPYNFNDLTYCVHCSYGPQPIFVNFESKYEFASTRAIALGWGGTKPQKPGDPVSHLLQESSRVIVDKKVCANIVNTQEIIYIIEKYLLCASNNFNDDRKDTKIENQPPPKDCKLRRYDSSKAVDNDGCSEDDFRRKNNGNNKNYTNKTENFEGKSQRNETDAKNYTNAENYHYTSHESTKSSSSFLGPCQKGHGCPLIRLVGDKEVIIGVASNVNKNNGCSGPSLYVSTAATSKIIKCLLETNSMTRKFCNQEISDKRYEVQEIDIIWPDYIKEPQLEPMPIKRSIPSDQQLLPRPTKDIVSRAEELATPNSYKQQQSETDPSYDPAYKQDRAQPLDHAPEQMYNRPQAHAESYQQPQAQMVSSGSKSEINGLQSENLGQRVVGSPQYQQPLGQQYEQQPGQQFEQPLEQEYEQPPGPQNEQPPEEQYEPPQGQQYEQPPEQQQQYELQSRQQYEPPPGQEYQSPPGQQGQDYGISPGQRYDPPPDKRFEQPLREQYESQPGQQYEQPGQQYAQPEQQYDQPGAQYGQPGQQYEQPGQQYEQPGQQYEQPGQQYEQPGQQYEQPSGQQNEPPSGQQYEQPSGQQNEPPSEQQYDAMPAQQNPSPAAQQFMSPSELQNDPRISHQNDSLADLQYEQPYEQQYKPPPEQQYGSSQVQQMGSPPIQLAESPAEQKYLPPTSKKYSPQSVQYAAQMGKSKIAPRQQYKTQPSQHYEQPSVQHYKSPSGQQLYKQPQGQPYQQPLEKIYNLQQTAKQPIGRMYVQPQTSHPNGPSYQQNFKQNQQPAREIDPRYAKPHSFDQIFTQLHNLPNETHPILNAPGREETFEQLYSNLHEPSFDLPHELNVPQYNGPPDELFEETEQQHGVEAPNSQLSGPQIPVAELTNLAPQRSDDLRARPQMPVDYQNDYFFYSYRRNDSAS